MLSDELLMARTTLKAGDCGVGRRLHSVPYCLVRGLFRLKRDALGEYPDGRHLRVQFAVHRSVEAGWFGVVWTRASAGCASLVFSWMVR